MSENSGYVYFIQSGENGPIKIGFTKNIENRMRALKTSSPYPLVLIGYFKSNRKLEKQLHRQFKEHKTKKNGEWFLPNAELLNLIEKAEKPPGLKSTESEQGEIYFSKKPKSKIKKKKHRLFNHIHLSSILKESGISVKDLAVHSEVSEEKIQNYIESDLPAWDTTNFALAEVRSLGEILNVQFVTHIKPPSDHKFMEFNFQNIQARLNELNIDVMHLIYEVGRRNFPGTYLDIDFELQHIQKRMFQFSSKSQKGVKIKVYPVMKKLELNYLDISQIGQVLKVSYY